MTARDPLERPLTVVECTAVAQDVVLLSLGDADGGELPPWTPGAHLELVLPSGLVRHYSLCGNPGDRERYTVAVLRVADGRGGSVEIHDSALVGQELLVRGPRNHFELGAADHYLFLAGGIGITPLVAMATQVAAEGHDWKLIYGARSRQAMAFRDRLASLGAAEQVEFVPQDEAGLPDFESLMRGAQPGTAVYACGPPAMLQFVEELAAKYADRLILSVERFAAGDDASHSDAQDTEFEIELARAGIVRCVPADRTILEIVLEELPDHPYSCTEGVCGSCETAVLLGLPDHRDQVLTEFERSTNETMMICVGRSLSRRLVLDL